MRFILIFFIFIHFSARVSADEKTVTFDHSNDQVGVAYVDAQPGEYIQVTIKNTCDEFVQTVKGVSALPASGGLEALVSCKDEPKEKYCAPFEKTFVIPHNGDYDGYHIAYRSAQGVMYQISTEDYSEACGATPQKDPKEKAIKLSDTNYTVIVNSSPWVAEFSGGLAVSWLTDPHFYVQDVSAIDDAPAYRRVARDKVSEDDQDLMFAAFAHVRNKSCTFGGKTFCRNIAITAGLGTESGQEIDYFLGASYKLGAAYITTGYHWGQVNRLKTGVAVGTIVDGTTVTNDVVFETNLAKQTDGAFFLALTYSFGGDSKTDFIKRIAPSSP